MCKLSIEEAAEILNGWLKPTTVRFGDISNFLKNNYGFSEDESWLAFKQYLKKYVPNPKGSADDFGSVEFEESKEIYID